MTIKIHIFGRKCCRRAKRTSRHVAKLFTYVAALSLMLPLHASAQSLLRDTEIEEILQDFTTPILEAAELTPSSVDLYLVNDNSLNAFVTRGQNIFLHSGLILEANNPNQLKGVIAHEAGHIVGAHIVRRDYGNRSAYGAFLIAAGVGLAAILAGEGQAGALVLGGSQQFAQVEALAYSRTNESAADQYAAQFMEKTGQSGTGLIAFFEKFRAQELLSQARRFPYFRGHPLSARRIDALRPKILPEYRLYRISKYAEFCVAKYSLITSSSDIVLGISRVSIGYNKLINVILYLVWGFLNLDVHLG